MYTAIAHTRLPFLNDSGGVGLDDGRRMEEALFFGNVRKPLLGVPILYINSHPRSTACVQVVL